LEEGPLDISLVMTLLGKDQPGIVEAISSVVATHGGNWQESQLARLSGRFAGFIRISTPSASAAALEAGLLKLATPALALSVDRVEQDEPDAGFARASLDLVGQDRPGILREITAALAAEGVNVGRLHTHCESAPMSGEMLFHAQADLLCPDGVSIEKLREGLEQIGQDMMVEVNLAQPND
jgi:glycine cleavage system regulatory protein